jgi:Copper type II ascorbate-dependent monooxygenase, C-terminal domain
MPVEFNSLLLILCSLSTPVTFQPGDEIRVNCVYRSIGLNTSTMAGASPTDEMCFGFIAIYPALDSFSECSQWRSAEICSDIGIRCNVGLLSYYVLSMLTVCQSFTSCSLDCKQTMQAIANTGCLDGDIAQYLQTIDKGISYLQFIAGLCQTTNIAGPVPVAETFVSPPLSCPTAQQPGKTQASSMERGIDSIK